MEYLTFHEDYDLSIAVLGVELDYDGMKRNYIDKGLIACGGNANILKEVIAYKLPTILTGEGRRKKRKPLIVAEQREYFDELIPTLIDLGVEYAIVTNPNYFKTVTGKAKPSAEFGKLCDPHPDHYSQYDGKIKFTFAPNHKMAFYDPVKTETNIKLATSAIVDDRVGRYKDPGEGIIKHAHYPVGIKEITRALQWLWHNTTHLTVDIEGFSLDAEDAGIGSIAFAWNKHEGISFAVDPAPGIYNVPVRRVLYEFLQARASKGRKSIFHHAGYDVTVLIHQLTKMLDIDDTEVFFDVMTHPDNVEDTKIISYLATNSCAGNKLGLKDQAVEFAGNYAQEDIKDIRKIPVPDLLEYNLVDCLSTWFTYDKNYPIMVADDQESVYREIFLPSLTDIIDMQLNGLPVDMEEVAIAKKELQDIQDAAVSRMHVNNPVLKAYLHTVSQEYVDKKNSEYKKKRITLNDVSLSFNPGSSQQVCRLLYDQEFMDLPVLARTKTGAPSTKGADIKALKHHTVDPTILSFIDALVDFKDTAILLSTFIPALENARLAPDGNYYMHGNFNLGGTLSGRLSSSDPNLQNIPSKSRLAKYIKKCIKAVAGWIFVGLDYDSLEDKISALITKDPNKLKVYTDGYDGHSLRAFTYFGHHMPDIDPSSVVSINSIADKYPDWRQRSKAPTFLLTYGGTYHGLKSNCGFPEPVAKMIESGYHLMYKVSDDWVASKIQKAADIGYVSLAFGLRLRTPILEKTILGNRRTPNAAKAESRTAGNALGQSWGLLNNRAASEFMQRVRKSPATRRTIKICCQIHDAQYYLIKAQSSTLKWFNDNLVDCVKWQNDPAIAHPDVKLSGKTSIFYPTWAEEHVLKNDASVKEIKELCASIEQKYAA